MVAVYATSAAQASAGFPDRWAILTDEDPPAAWWEPIAIILGILAVLLVVGVPAGLHKSPTPWRHGPLSAHAAAWRAQQRPVARGSLRVASRAVIRHAVCARSLEMSRSYQGVDRREAGQDPGLRGGGERPGAG